MWYEQKPVAPGITWIREARLDPFQAANIWHIRGRDHDIVVDTGFGFRPLRPVIKALSGAPVLAVATHTHCDHIGAMYEFDARAVHAAEAPVLAAPSPSETLINKVVSSRIFLDGGPPDDIDLDAYVTRPAAATRLVADGEIIDLGNRRLTVVHVPGHSPGGIVLFEEASGVLITGDMLHNGAHGIGRYVWPHSDAEAFLSSIRRLMQLAPHLVLPGHFAPFDGDRAFEIVEEYESFHQRRARDDTFAADLDTFGET